jgi:hypothetical protein
LLVFSFSQWTRAPATVSSNSGGAFLSLEQAGAARWPQVSAGDSVPSGDAVPSSELTAIHATQCARIRSLAASRRALSPPEIRVFWRSSSDRKTTSRFATRSSPASASSCPRRGATGREVRPLPEVFLSSHSPPKGTLRRRRPMRSIGFVSPKSPRCTISIWIIYKHNCSVYCLAREPLRTFACWSQA